MYTPINKLDIQKLLNTASPETYDLKDEMEYEGKTALEKELNYKIDNRGFECDGCTKGYYCVLIRDIYNLLWDWKNKGPRGGILKHATTCLGNEILMGPETINSFSTTYNIYKELINYDSERELINLFSTSVGRIGNMTLTIKGFNRYVAYDYWDVKIKRQYLDDDPGRLLNSNMYINLFFQWDYVEVKNGKYTFKPFWEYRNKYYLPTNEKHIESYIMLVDRYTKRRGLFMAEMIKIAQNNIDEYKKIREIVFMSSEVFDGYPAVIERICKLDEISEKTRESLSLAKSKIAKY